MLTATRQTFKTNWVKVGVSKTPRYASTAKHQKPVLKTFQVAPSSFLNLRAINLRRLKNRLLQSETECIMSKGKKNTGNRKELLLLNFNRKSRESLNRLLEICVNTRPNS